MMKTFRNQQLGIFKRSNFLSLFVLALLLSLVLGITTPILSQTVSPSPKDGCYVPQTLCADIQQLAQEDVADDIPRRTSYAIELFKEKHPDWTTDPAKAKLEISRTYDRKYSQQEKAKKQDLQAAWEKWSENGLLVPFVGVIILAVVAWFKDVIGKAWTTLVKAIDNWVYERFAGTPLFERVSLKHYREALMENYQHLKIPFRVNHKPLEMGEVFVPLKVAGSSDSDQVDAYRAIAQHRRLMITGIPGSRKTMLLRHIVFSYGKGRLPELKNRSVPVLLELHRLSDPNLTEEKLIAAIAEAFKRNRFPNAERFVRHSLQHGKLMLLLDGLDEVNSGVRPALAQCISDLLKSLDEHQRCRLIVTCRTQVYDNEFANETDQTLEVVEFTDQQMRRFLGAWQREIPAGKSIDQLMQTLRDRPRIMALARNPLLLTIIAHLYTDPAFELPRSRSEFYQESTRILLEQWQDQLNRYRGSDKRRVLQYLALHQQQASTQQQQDRRSIDYPVVLEKIKQLLPSLNLDPNSDTIPLLDELVERSGLFLRIDGGDRYQFAHLTLQEYFAAVALADKPHDLVQFFQQDPTNWREVVKLWCGIAGNSTALIMDIYQQDTLLGFECLAEAQEVDQQTADVIIEHCKEMLGSAGEQDEVTKAFGAVAASDRPRGQAVFHFLETALRDEQEAHRHGAIAEALSLSNRPQAAKVLADCYATSLQTVRLPLIRMGDLAVPQLQLLVQRNYTSAINDLFSVGTPDAAKALAVMLWTRGFGQTSAVAFYLAALLLQPGVEEVLQDYIKENRGLSQIKDYEELWKPFVWVWHPFQTPENAEMSMMMGRIFSEIYGGLITNYISHSLSSTPVSRLDMSAAPFPGILPFALDSRIVVPVLAVLSNHIFQSFPSTWNPEQVDALLEQHEQTPELEQKALYLMNTFFVRTSSYRSWSDWQILLAGLPPILQLDLLRSLFTAKRPIQIDDWRNIFQSVQYEFKTSRHYRLVLLIAAVLSLHAIWGIWQTASLQSVGAMTGVMGMAVVIICVFWWALANEVEEPWEPNLFVKLGVLGVRTYGVELHQLFQNHLVWPGIKVIFELFESNFAGAFVGIYSGAFAFSIAFVSVFAVASAIAFAGAVTTAFTGAVAFALAFTGTFAACSIGGLAGIGIGCWYRIKAEPQKQWLKFLAVLALPWFCTAPIVLGFAWVGLTTSFTPLTFLPIPPWQFAVLVELVLIGISCLLWWWGQKREAIARNPLQGGLIEATLRAQYGRPRKA